MFERVDGRGPLAVIVMGVAGCGKSTLGAALAGALGCPFLEGDDFHAPEAVDKMRAGISLTDRDRWPWLDRLGRAAGVELATGGLVVASCSALKRSYRDRLRGVIPGMVVFVQLEGDPDELRRRLAVRTSHYMPASLLDSQFETLERPEADEAALCLDGGAPIELLCKRVGDWLRAGFPAAY